jgi:hypothetical protein
MGCKSTSPFLYTQLDRLVAPRVIINFIFITYTYRYFQIVGKMYIEIYRYLFRAQDDPEGNYILLDLRDQVRIYVETRMYHVGCSTGKGTMTLIFFICCVYFTLCTMSVGSSSICWPL